LNNPVRYIDPTGHVWTEIGRATLTIAELRLLISEFSNWEASLKATALILGGADVLLGGAALTPLGAAIIMLLAILIGLEGEQAGWVKDFLNDVLDAAEDAAKLAADALGLAEGSDERKSFIENYTIDLIVSDVSGEGFFWNSMVVLTSSVTGTLNIYLSGILALNLGVMAPTW
jgi:hypothetical protein